VEQFVLDMAKMTANDHGCLLVGDDFAQPEVLGERAKYQPSDAGCRHGNERIQQQTAHARAEVKLVFQQIVHQKNSQYQSNRDQTAADELIEIIAPDERIQFYDQNIIMTSRLPHTMNSIMR